MIVDFNGDSKDFFLEKLRLFSGNVNTELTFEYGNGTESAYGCGTTFQNEFWYFGGNTNKRQVKYFYREGLKNKLRIIRLK